MNRNIHVTIAAFAWMVLMTGCASTPLSTIWKMRNFDPLNADPSQIQFAVITHREVTLSDDSTSMTLSFDAQDAAHSFSHTAMASVTSNAMVPALMEQIKPHQKITSFHLEPQDAEALRLAQSKLRNIKNLDLEGTGSVSISITHGCLSKQLIDSNPSLSARHVDGC